MNFVDNVFVLVYWSFSSSIENGKSSVCEKIVGLGSYNLRLLLETRNLKVCTFILGKIVLGNPLLSFSLSNCRRTREMEGVIMCSRSTGVCIAYQLKKKSCYLQNHVLD